MFVRNDPAVTLKIRNLDKLQEVLGKVVSAGSNSMSGLTFSVSDPEKYLADARKKAIADARVRAETFTKAAGVELGPLISMIEQTGNELAPRTRTDSPFFRQPFSALGSLSNRSLTHLEPVSAAPTSDACLQQ
jgi:uncharacterized protein YggE